MRRLQARGLDNIWQVGVGDKIYIEYDDNSNQVMLEGEKEIVLVARLWTASRFDMVLDQKRRSHPRWQN